LPQFEQKRPLGGLLVPQRVQRRSGARWGENSNCGAGGRIGASLARGALEGVGGGANVAGGAKNGGSTEGVAGGAGAAAGAAGCTTGARPRGGVGATPAPSPEIRRFPQS